MYRPLLEYARNQWNRSRRAQRAERGRTTPSQRAASTALDPEMAAGLPELDLDDRRAPSDVRCRSSTSREHGGSEETVDQYYQAQVVWDETMGSRVASTL